MLCEMGGEIRRYCLVLVKLVVMESLGAHINRLKSKLISRHEFLIKITLY